MYPGQQTFAPTTLRGDELPEIVTAVPGPASSRWLSRLASVESRNVTFVGATFPVAWQEAAGAAVVDVDGNRYIDATAAFGVAFCGHRAPTVVAAAQRQMATLVHGMGDVHPPAVRIRLLEELDRITPSGVGHAVLCTGGAEAVEVAIKTALLHTSRPGIVAFEGGYHGLTIGALLATSRSDFRATAPPYLGNLSHFAPFPRAISGDDSGNDARLEESLQAVGRYLADPVCDVGIVIVEPIQGRGGTIVPPASFLPRLAALCGDYGVLLCVDEIFTGMGRTGAWFASESNGFTPDLLCVGKALGGGMPLSACLGKPDVMASWGKSTGEALHTSTFLGHPVACAAALAAIAAIEDGKLMQRARWLGEHIRDELTRNLAESSAVAEIRGEGLMIGIECAAMQGHAPGDIAWSIVEESLRNGLILLPSGDGGCVIQLTPPAVITREQVDAAITILARAFDKATAAHGA